MAEVSCCTAALTKSPKHLTVAGELDIKWLCGSLNPDVSQVGRELQVNRLLLKDARTKTSIDLGHGVLGCDPRLGHAELATTLHHVLEVAVSGSVMQQSFAFDFTERRSPRNRNDGQVLRIRSRDTAEGTQFANSVCCDERAQSSRPSVAVGRICCIKLVAAANPLGTGRRLHLLQ